MEFWQARRKHSIRWKGRSANSRTVFQDMRDIRHAPARSWSRTYGLRPELLAVTQVWASEDGSPLIVATKGAPGGHRSAVPAIGEPKAPTCRLQWTRWRRQGMRVLAVAQARYIGTTPARRPHRVCLQTAWPHRIRRPAARECSGRGATVPVGWHQGRDDNRRLSGNRRRHRAPGWPRCEQSGGW